MAPEENVITQTASGGPTSGQILPGQPPAVRAAALAGAAP